jgi:hypothetical protein
MNVDNVQSSEENLGLFAAQPQTIPASVLQDWLGEMPVVVLDFGALGFEQTNAILKASSEPCRFVIWYPWRYTPSEVVQFHRELVVSGATLVEKESENQNWRECWDERKAELEELRISREARVAARLSRRAARLKSTA